MEFLYNIILLYKISININKDHKNGGRVGTVNRDRMKSRYKAQFGLKLTLRLLMSYIYGAPSKARNANVVYVWTYVWQG